MDTTSTNYLSGPIVSFTCRYQRTHQARGKTNDLKHDGAWKMLRDDLPFTLHKPIRRWFASLPVLVIGINHHWAADLEMQPLARYNGGHRYLLTVLAVFSKQRECVGSSTQRQNGYSSHQSLWIRFEDDQPRFSCWRWKITLQSRFNTCSESEGFVIFPAREIPKPPQNIRLLKDKTRTPVMKILMIRPVSKRASYTL